MSDLAPFVAAALRDKVICDLMEENEKLKKELQQSRTVQITGPHGDPVYSQARFDDGAYAENPNLWEVDFPSGQQLLSCPLADLQNIEVQIEGVCKAMFRDHSSFEGWAHDFDDYDDDNQKGVHFCFSGGSGGLWLALAIHGWPRQRWPRERDGEGFLDYLTQDVASQPPTKTVTLLSVSFFNRSFGGLINALPIDQETEEETERRREHAELQVEIVERMRLAGNDEPPSVFATQVAEVVVIIERLGLTDINVSGPLQTALLGSTP